MSAFQPEPDLRRVADVRHGFVIADLVLRDILADYVRGTAAAAELRIALRQHRAAYEDYFGCLSACAVRGAGPNAASRARGSR